MQERSVGAVALFGALLFASPTAHAHLAQPGYTGLISTPTPDILQNGKVAIGFSWLSGPETYLFPPKTNRVYSVAVGILPGLETTMRHTQVIGWHDPDAPGVAYAFDRMFSAKFALPTPDGFPRMALGVQDIASANFLAGVRGARPGVTQYGQTTLYGVLGESHSHWGWHAGVASSQAFINGPFAGIVYRPVAALAFMGEWDSQRLNVGIRTSPFDGVSLQLTSINLGTIGLGCELEVAL